MEQQPSIFSPDRAGRVRTFYTEKIAIEGAMKVGIPREVAPGERRVAATPDTVKVLQEMGFDVQIEKGAGLKASYFDSAYEEAGATLVSAEQIWSESDLVLKLEPPTLQEASSIREGAHLISFIWPGDNDGLVDALKARGVTCIAMENIPRITLALQLDCRRRQHEGYGRPHGQSVELVRQRVGFQ